MLSQTTLERYFEALGTQNGAVAASLFTEEGAIDDFRGNHHAGRAVIERFINQVPPQRHEFPWPFVIGPQRGTVYGRIHFDGKESVLVRWVFSFGGGQIAHLCNSRIENVPAHLRSS